MTGPAPENPGPAEPAPLAEVRYPLPVLLREVEIERRAPAFAGEKLDQLEIKKLFQKKPGTRRAVRKRE
ncbi:MAG TPA: hypothetical protein VEB66_18130 [Opitutaceae bacterium]|nr:hypothetical protein [Opitutaceae bacterium]